MIFGSLHHGEWLYPDRPLMELHRPVGVNILPGGIDPVHQARYLRLYSRTSRCAFLPHANATLAQRPGQNLTTAGKYPARNNARCWKIAFVKCSRNTRRLTSPGSRAKKHNRLRRPRIRNSSSHCVARPALNINTGVGDAPCEPWGNTANQPQENHGRS